MTKLMMLARIAGGFAVLTIIVLSVVPGNMRPHVLGNDYLEHFVAYFITGCFLSIGYLRPLQLLAIGILLAICAASLEFVQLWIPGRDANAADFVVSAIGAWIGLLVIVVVRRTYQRTFIASYK